ncbi:hypothetical protein OJF2_50060 [Aquisphaera giovannonii]|uniref:Uncharacterized protein n=1 Tax=Aquisphaera giovannonii TaxID=406548 RepID=A0A5B9W6Z0_9BACT|nr:hypothetical protein [Aquisphaera giovannonii]QEH36442.1 hypothetical protein OJF2_50060 [Aquisphaera giovannonii]
MTPRTLETLRRVAAAVVLAGGLASAVGCDPRPFFYFLQPFEPTIPAPGPSLANKKVVVLAHGTSQSQSEFPGIERELTTQFVSNLKKKAKKITVVDQKKVQTWMEGHPNSTDPSDAARDFEADVVIFLELETFQIQEPGDLNVLQGSARVHIKATEMDYPKNSKGKSIKDQPKEAHEIYDNYQESTFPIRGPVPMESGVGRMAFKNKFIQVVGGECSWHFVEHSEDDVIQDVKFNQR